MTTQAKAIGALEAQVAYLNKNFDQMSADVRAIRKIMDKAEGGWKVLVVIGGISSAVTVVLIKIATYLPFFNR